MIRSIPREAARFSRAAQWLLDNEYLLLRTIRSFERDLPYAFARRLRVTNKGTFRIERIVHELLEDPSLPVSRGALDERLRERRAGAPLDLAELWALPVLIRVAVLETLLAATSDLSRLTKREGADDPRIRATILTLHLLEQLDWSDLVTTYSQVERILQRERHGTYPRLDDDTRNAYRSEVEHVARYGTRSELEVAREVVHIAGNAHAGEALFGEQRAALEAATGYVPPPGVRLRRFVKAHPTAVLTSLTALGALPFPALALTYLTIVTRDAPMATSVAWIAAITLLLAIPAWSLGERVAQRIVQRILPPHRLPKLDLRHGVPSDALTLVVIPCLVHDAEEVDALLGRMEHHYLTHTDPMFSFAFLVDFADADREVLPSDAPLRERFQRGVHGLRARHPQGRFHLLIRSRRFEPSEGYWMGWERKRGKLMELLALLLHGDAGSFTTRDLNDGMPLVAKYVLTLDADTVLPPGAAYRLLGAALHPQARSRHDADGRLTGGFTVFQPRVELQPPETATPFARWYANTRGIDLYAHAVSEPLMDLFGEGLFAGKGLIDVAAFDRATRGRIPTCAVLSHDTLEGGLGRAAHVSDVIVLETPPSRWDAYLEREMRWLRGDWQILPWLLPAPHRTDVAAPLPEGSSRYAAALSKPARWAMVHNLLSSLHAPFLLTGLLLAWTVLPGSPAVWTLAWLAWSGAPLALHAFDRLPGSRWRRIRFEGHAPPQAWSRWLLDLGLLPQRVATSLVSVTRTLLRVFVTRRGLLAWRTAAMAERDSQPPAWLRAGAHGAWAGPATSAIVATAWWASTPSLDSWIPAAPFLLTWLTLPWWTGRLDAPPRRGDGAPLHDDDRAWLEMIARRTWAYFERHVGPEDHWLPPDHVQEDRRDAVAHRTSPTNIGMLLTSTLAAYDRGFLTASVMLERLTNTLGTLTELDRRYGHFLNWYDTRTLQPLEPRYLSTVDSGNLLTSMLAVKQGCLDLQDDPPVPTSAWRGAVVLLDLLAEALTDVVDTAGQLEPALAAVRDPCTRGASGTPLHRGTLTTLMEEALPRLEMVVLDLVESTPRPTEVILTEVTTWLTRVRHHVDVVAGDIHRFTPWLTWHDLPKPVMELVQSIPDDVPLRTLPTWYRALRRSLLEGGDPSVPFTADELQRVLGDLYVAEEAVANLTRGVQTIAFEVERYLTETRWDVVFDDRRLLFRLGWFVDDDRLDAHAYDLLASEARLASFLAIALGQVPAEHWLHLGRPFGVVDDRRVLLSWSGTMFEYLMPPLFLRAQRGSLLHLAERSAVRVQRAFGDRHDVPWGVSESAYARTDVAGGYQYRAFGVHALALSRDVPERRVVASYASLLALPFDPSGALANLRRLAREGALGTLGFYEAVDYTPAHLPPGKHHQVIRSYMVHHHGMGLLGLCNLLDGERFVERFHADARIASCVVLLAEAPGETEPVEVRGRTARPQPRAAGIEEQTSRMVHVADADGADVAVLAGGHLSTLVTAAGGGGLRWRELDVTRWHRDTVRDAHGTWWFLADLDERHVWSPTRMPIAGDRHDGYGDVRVTFEPHRASFQRRVGTISTGLDVFVVPHADVEVRSLTIRNHANRRRRLRVSTFAELALTQHEADARHRAFEGLFTWAEVEQEGRVAVATRLPRSETERRAWVAQTGVVHGNDGRTRMAGWRAAVTRDAFLSRAGHGEAWEAARRVLASTREGFVLDPALVGQCDVEIPARGEVEVVLVTAMAGTRDEAIHLASGMLESRRIAAARGDAEASGERAVMQVGLDSETFAALHAILGGLLAQQAALRPDAGALQKAWPGNTAVWPLGISGDHPLLVVRVTSHDDVRRVRSALQAHRWWRERGVAVDLVLGNERDAGYARLTQELLLRLVSEAGDDVWRDRPGGVFLPVASQLGDGYGALLARANVVLGGREGAALITPRAPGPRALPRLEPSRSLTHAASYEDPDVVRFANGVGGFAADETAFDMTIGRSGPPAPWVNILANARFGTMVSERGSMHTWFGNASEFRLTPWSNDALQDATGEAIYLRDEETARVWSPLPGPMATVGAYRVRHAVGESVFDHEREAVASRVRVFTAAEASWKAVTVRVSERSGEARRLTVTAYLAWLLGTYRERDAWGVLPGFDAERGILFARNPRSPAFADQVAFLAADTAPHGVTGNRRSFLGRHGSERDPAALHRMGLDGRVVAGDDPCAALQVHVDLPALADRDVTFFVGVEADLASVRARVDGLREDGRVEAERRAVRGAWQDRLGALQVDTPDEALNRLVNGWLGYQTLSSRVWGRTAFYQSSGAFGFRDQLQDALSILHGAPEVARGVILEAARHQFEEGDVLHWWHPPTGAGVRTRIRDDLAWLPYVVARYVGVTGDVEVLDEVVPFLSGAPLEAGEDERYDVFAVSGEEATLFEHVLRAVDHASTRGVHGLPLMGGGDWNDGMNRVGVAGRGESVWLAWFLMRVLRDVADLCVMRGLRDRAERYRAQADAYGEAVETHAWDGDWYVRAFFDDGTPLGSRQSDEAQIDAIAQAWAVLSGAGREDRVDEALDAAWRHLVMEEEGIVRLLTPPFARSAGRHDPGYIAAYPPGVRENGGQYTHGAIWLAWAFAERGNVDRAWRAWRMLNPSRHADTAESVAQYRVEPYVVAADVYAEPPYVGRGGWTWYTGSAGWMYRFLVEALLGIRREGRHLRVTPLLPREWSGFAFTYRAGTARYLVQVRRGAVARVHVDGVEVEGNGFELVDDGVRHEVTVEVPDLRGRCGGRGVLP